jgi:hypothetical protein
MSHALLVSDHQFLNETLKVNLQSYLSCKLVVIADLSQLKQLLSIDQTYDFILCLTSLAKKDITKDVSKIKDQFIKNAPLIFLGHLNTPLPATHNLVNPFDILSLIRLIAKELKWSAQDLINRPSAEYIPVSLRLLAETPDAIDDLYWKNESLAEPFVLVANHKESLSEKLMTWRAQNITELYIKAQNRLRAMGVLNKSLMGSLSAAIDKPEIADVAIVQDAATVVSEYFTDVESVSQLPEEVRIALGQLALKTSELVSQLTLKIPSTLNKMVELFQKSPSNFIPRHSFLTTYFAIEMIKTESWYSHQVNEKVCVLLFFHDVVLLPLYHKHKDLPLTEERLVNSSLLSDKEKQLVHWHPKLIAQMLEHVPGIPIGLDQLIMQHHGTLNGSIAKDEIHDEVSMLAKVIVVAEAFTTELLVSKFPLTKEHRDAIIFRLKQKFTKRSYAKLIPFLEKFEF